MWKLPLVRVGSRAWKNGGGSVTKAATPRNNTFRCASRALRAFFFATTTGFERFIARTSCLRGRRDLEMSPRTSFPLAKSRSSTRGVMSMDGFTALQASRFTGSTGNQLRYWDKIGLVKPAVQATGGRPGVRRLYSFRDLVALKVVKSLLDGGMSLQRVRRAYEYLRGNARLEEELSSVKLVTDGKSIFKI